MNTNTDNSMDYNNQSHTEIDEVTQDKIIAGHEYDGIKELDNDLPPWWKYLFYITIAFAAIYLVRYHVIKTGDLQATEYENEMIAAAEKYKPSGDQINENTITVLSDQASLDAGREVYKKICSACHAMNGEGLVGPNFTDEYWIHGGTIKDMYKIVISGVIEKGMISYKDQLTGKQIQEVLSYIISLKGSNPPNKIIASRALSKRLLYLASEADSASSIIFFSVIILFICENINCRI